MRGFLGMPPKTKLNGAKRETSNVTVGKDNSYNELLDMVFWFSRLITRIRVVKFM
jgi:hypothetical protein